MRRVRRYFRTISRSVFRRGIGSRQPLKRPLFCSLALLFGTIGSLRCATPPPVPPAAALENVAPEQKHASVWCFDLVRPGVGVGPLNFGMLPVETDALLGAPEATELFHGEGAEPDTMYHSHFQLGLSLAFERDAARIFRLATVFIYSGVRGGYESGRHQRFRGFPDAPPAEVKFPAMREVLAARGAPLKRGALSFAPIPSTWLDYSVMSLDFVTETGELIYMSVSRD